MDPLVEYVRRRDSFRAEQQALEKEFVAVGNWRLAIGLGAAVLAWFVFARRSASPWWLLVLVFAFTGLVVWHQKIIRRRTLAGRGVAYYERSLARLGNAWLGTGLAGERYRDQAHVYAEDLDLFGKGGLFEFIAITRTTAGEDTLAGWLLRPAETEEVLLRQGAVAELRGNLKLREDLALLAEDVCSDVNIESLSRWGLAPPVKFAPILRPLAILLAICGVAGVIAIFGGAIPLWPLAVVLGCDFALIFALRRRVTQILEGIEASGRDLRIFSALVARLEKETFESAKLCGLRGALSVAGKAASLRIAKLSRLTDWLDSSDHILVRALRHLVLWREQLAIAFEKWRAQSGPHVGTWIRAVAEFEALSSLAALAFERPSWTTPDIIESAGPWFEAVALQHPLLSPESCVPNDLELNRERRLLVVSGSNMSGKSTLLRAVGLNAVLAWAGAPVAAKTLRISPVQIGASIRVSDSLQDHRSRFLAEITRIRQIVDLTKTGAPVLFLMDELLSGTNSHDRRIGAAGIVRELLRSNAVGLITTHDLALTNIEEDVNSGVLNVHFEDQMNGTEMVFDYKLKAGVVRRSNAIELMRAVGLDV